ncbi:MAG: dynamin family protein [Candidatus Eremiobacteraeota bacterium]|nr:dynamin family protein [Candidatus Eremiobacteraeota bacterium]
MSTVNSDAMVRYAVARDDAASALRELQKLLPGAASDEIERERRRLERESFVLAIVGEFSSGKSFLLNALLGKIRYEELGNERRVTGLLATDINPSTATITELQYGRPEHARAIYSDGREERIPIDHLSRFIAVGHEEGKLHDQSADEQTAPTRVIVCVDSAFLQRGFTVADTPGLASINPAHRRATLSFLPTADAVLYLIDTQQPFTEGDAAFLGIIRQHIQSIFIVQTKIDLWQTQQSDGLRAWEAAHARIVSLSAIHAPSTYVYAVSARNYAEGVLRGSRHLLEQSRFQELVDDLDASLVTTTGRARLGQTLSHVNRIVSDACARIEHDLTKFPLSMEALHRQRNAVLPQLEAIAQSVRSEQEVVRGEGLNLAEKMRGQGSALYEDLKTALERAFDTADIARLQDRAKLHIIIDGTVADVVGDFATYLAAGTVASLENASKRCQQIVRLDFSIADACAPAFGASAGAGAWSAPAHIALRATIVLEAVGGISMSVVNNIANRFTAEQTGQYMKRELIADLRAEVFPCLRNEIEVFVESLIHRIDLVFANLITSLSDAFEKEHERAIGSIDRALQLKSDPIEIAKTIDRLAETRGKIEHEFDRVASSIGTFLERNPEAAPPQTGLGEVRRAHADFVFDADAYDRGLRPERWRVCLLGALRRGKSSVINAVAGTRVLRDETAGRIAFPVHVRYGAVQRAHALSEGGEWTEVEIESALNEATRNPVLIETPWSLPPELVLVHAPAFDTSDVRAADICMVAARAASEVVCLFSRQLSDRELDMYARVADLNKPMVFVHTLADNETPRERREVVELASRYLRERNVVPRRIFTVSTFEYNQARREGRAPAGWNELDALIATLSGHAEEHMQRLARLKSASLGTKLNAAAEADAEQAEGRGLVRWLQRFFPTR